MKGEKHWWIIYYLVLFLNYPIKCINVKRNRMFSFTEYGEITRASLLPLTIKFLCFSQLLNQRTTMEDKLVSTESGIIVVLFYLVCSSVAFHKVGMLLHPLSFPLCQILLLKSLTETIETNLSHFKLLVMCI